jgi:hypothetical protein
VRLGFAELVPPEIAWMLVVAGLAILVAMLWAVLRGRD